MCQGDVPKLETQLHAADDLIILRHLN